MLVPFSGGERLLVAAGYGANMHERNSCNIYIFVFSTQEGKIENNNAFARPRFLSESHCLVGRFRSTFIRHYVG